MRIQTITAKVRSWTEFGNECRLISNLSEKEVLIKI